MVLQTAAEAYVQALIQGGALPVLIPIGLGSTDLEQLLDRLDGVLFTGGGDIAPAQYDAPDHPSLGGVDTSRDELEIALVRLMIERELPFLGICRGLQVINVALGGSLYTDIADQHSGAIKHDFQFTELPRNYLAHTAQIRMASKLGETLGQSEVNVNSLHHQAVQRLASGLVPTAYAPDGILEAFELDNYPFGLAVQWHPEWLVEHEPMRKLFQAFVQTTSQMKYEIPIQL